MARTMINEYSHPQYIWAEVINTSCYINNRIYFRKKLEKTPFEIYHLKKPNISYLKVFCCKYFVLNTRKILDKFDSKAYEEIFVGYSSTSKDHRIFNKSTLTLKSMHVKLEESNKFVKNVVDYQIDSLGEDMEKTTMKNLPALEDKQREELSDEVQEAQENTQPTQSLLKDWR